MTPERFRKLKAVLERRQPDLTVLMDGVHKPHNFSAVLRSCDATGVFRAHVVPASSDFDIYHGTAAGSSRWVDVDRHGSIDDAVRVIRNSGARLLAAHPSPEAVEYSQIDYTSPTCIVVGAELHGVSARGLELADELIQVPMAGMVGSLNVSVATAVVLFEAFRQRTAAGMYDHPRLATDTLEKTLFEWAHPRIAAKLRKAGKPYPKLDEDGEIVRPTE